MPSPPSDTVQGRDDHIAARAKHFRDVSLDEAISDTEDVEKPLNPDGFDAPTGRASAKVPPRPSLAPGISILARRPSYIDDEDDPIALATTAKVGPNQSHKDEPVTWMSLPKKGQLAVLTIARLSEPLSERSLAAYMFYQLRSFNPDASDSKITSQGGMLTASFAAAQFLTAVWWGRAADTPWIGRKRVLLIGLLGTCISSIGVGFSKSFAQALFFRACAGCLNGNVGVMRTMISEIIKEKKYQSRAFLLLPMCFNIGVVIGPILGGFLADPVTSFPNVFGPGSSLGGNNGVGWMTTFPYALPNVVSACIILSAALWLILGLDETHPASSNKPDRGRMLGKFLVRHLFRRGQSDSQDYEYTELSNQVELQEIVDAQDGEHSPRNRDNDPETPTVTKPADPSPAKLPFRKIFRKNVVLTLLCHHLLALHLSAFNALIFLFLPAPRSNNENAHLPFQFTGGMGLNTSKVGLATAIIGVIGFPLQVLAYPTINSKLGTLSSYKVFLPFSILAYFLTPYLALLPNKPFLVWPALAVTLALQVISRTFALPGSTILVNNCTPHPSVLGTIHGFAQSISSGARTVGPTLGGWLLGVGLNKNCVGVVWWGIAGVAALNWMLLWAVHEGDAGASAVGVK
ncbi:major facilitator superfamily domain-containing protein [Exophiala viscosa]|uniref:major facilitator superfamily domain-containing protein n=1 Tax=Exophiala viscosa TaxID=2486360 RepID=UPI002197F814|nr:major facilitator superfamily domain-containing protein [Exophiala viscosa]